MLLVITNAFRSLAFTTFWYYIVPSCVYLDGRAAPCVCVPLGEMAHAGSHHWLHRLFAVALGAHAHYMNSFVVNVCMQVLFHSMLLHGQLSVLSPQMCMCVLKEVTCYARHTS